MQHVKYGATAFPGLLCPGEAGKFVAAYHEGKGRLEFYLH
jgi:hypothetical protein